MVVKNLRLLVIGSQEGIRGKDMPGAHSGQYRLDAETAEGAETAE
jgi:hypothetical protein